METTTAVTITRESDTAAVAAWCAEQNLPAEVIGRWVWIEFDAKPDDDTRQSLKDAGFIWNHKRAAWQHSCNVRSRNSPKSRPWIEAKYGSVAVHAFTYDAAD